MTGCCKGPIGHRKENEMAKVSSRLNRISLQWPIDQFRYIIIQPRTIDFSMRLWGINTEFVGFIPQSLVLRSIVWDWILIYRNWSIHIINPVDKTKLSCNTSHGHSTTVSLEIYPLYNCNYVLGIIIMFSPGVTVRPNTILGVGCANEQTWTDWCPLSSCGDKIYFIIAWPTVL